MFTLYLLLRIPINVALLALRYSRTYLATHRRFGAVDEGDKNANHSQREEGDGVFHMCLRGCDDVGDIRNEKKHSQRHTNNCYKDAEVEDCRVLHG